MEREWAEALYRGDKVSVKIEVDWPKGASRPDGFNVIYTIEDVATGQRKTYNKSFINPLDTIHDRRH